MLLNYDLAHEFFRYDSYTGELLWAKTRNNRSIAGARVGTLNKNGVWQLCFDHKTYFQHRVIWLLVTGSWPERVIDHIDGNPANNAWSNLRDVSQSVNRQNLKQATARNTTGLLGVVKLQSGWCYAIKYEGRNVRKGPFESAELAHEAYLSHKRKVHEGCTI